MDRQEWAIVLLKAAVVMQVIAIVVNIVVAVKK